MGEIGKGFTAEGITPTRERGTISIDCAALLQEGACLRREEEKEKKPHEHGKRGVRPWVKAQMYGRERAIDVSRKEILFQKTVNFAAWETKRSGIVVPTGRKGSPVYGKARGEPLSISPRKVL